MRCKLLFSCIPLLLPSTCLACQKKTTLGTDVVNSSNRVFPQLMPHKLPHRPLGLSPAPFAVAVPILLSRHVCPPPAAPLLPPSRLIAASPPRSAQRGRRARALVARAFIRFLGPRPPAQPLPARPAALPPLPPPPAAAMQNASAQGAVVVDSDRVMVQAAAGAVGARRSRAPV